VSGKYHHFIKDMYREVLEELGLSPNEAKIYEGLLEIGHASVPEIALRIGVHKRNIYDLIPKLLRKGLIYQLADSKENRYAPIEPNKLSDFIWEKEAKLNSILPALNQQFKKISTGEAVYIYKGVEGFKNYLRDILDVGEDVYFIGAKCGWFDANLQTFIKKFLVQAKERNIEYHHIFDAEVKKLAPELLKTLGKPYRFLPPKYSTTSAIDIFGDRIVTFSGLTLKNITEDVTLVVIVNKELADCYRTWFQFVWDHCRY
jgi:sugar-specific transcriptional regulator TrmB